MGLLDQGSRQKWIFREEIYASTFFSDTRLDWGLFSLNPVRVRRASA